MKEGTLRKQPLSLNLKTVETDTANSSLLGTRLGFRKGNF